MLQLNVELTEEDKKRIEKLDALTDDEYDTRVWEELKFSAGRLMETQRLLSTPNRSIRALTVCCNILIQMVAYTVELIEVSGEASGKKGIGDMFWGEFKTRVEKERTTQRTVLLLKQKGLWKEPSGDNVKH